MTEQTNLFWPPNTPNVFGQLTDPGLIRQAAKTTLKTWLPDYINELASRRNVELLAVQDWTVRPEYRTLPQSQSPAVMVTSPGVIGSPTRDGDGNYRAHYNLQVSVVVWGDDWEPTEDVTGLYATAVIAALVQHPSLGGCAISTEWRSYRYAVVEHSSTRTLGAAQIGFDVAAEHVVNSDLGPATPSAGPFSPGLVASTHVTIDKEQP